MPRQPERAEELEPEDYLPGASADEPSVPYYKGWPQKLVDTEGTQYWRLRDGSGPAPAYNNMAGYDVIYGKIMDWDVNAAKPIVEGKRQYLPTGDSKMPDKVTMQGSGVWYEPQGYTNEPMFEPTFIRDLSHEQQDI
jgi:hypothetical protein